MLPSYKTKMHLNYLIFLNITCQLLTSGYQTTIYILDILVDTYTARVDPRYTSGYIYCKS